MLIPVVRAIEAPDNGTGETLELSATPITDGEYDLSTLATLTEKGERLYGKGTDVISIYWDTTIVTPEGFQPNNGTTTLQGWQDENPGIPEVRRLVSVAVKRAGTIGRLKTLGLTKSNKAVMALLNIEYDDDQTILSALIRETIPDGIRKSRGYSTQATSLNPSDPSHREHIVQMLHFISELITHPPE